MEKHLLFSPPPKSTEFLMSMLPEYSLPLTRGKSVRGCPTDAALRPHEYLKRLENLVRPVVMVPLLAFWTSAANCS
jgi:hypothetical protein